MVKDTAGCCPFHDIYRFEESQTHSKAGMSYRKITTGCRMDLMKAFIIIQEARKGLFMELIGKQSLR